MRCTNRSGSVKCRLLRPALSLLPLVIAVLCAVSSGGRAQGANGEVRRCFKTTSLYDTPWEDRREIGTVGKDDYVIVLEKSTDLFCRVEVDGAEGYMVAAFLKAVPNMSPGDLRGWVSVEKHTGDEPDCGDYHPRYDQKLDNYLRVRVGSFDVVVKVMSKTEEVCVRSVYIRAKGEFTMKNLPQDEYYLKIAYGLDWRQKTADSTCAGRFMKNASYEAGERILDYRVKPTEHGYSIPSYRLTLMPATEDPDRTFRTEDIDAEEFNR